MVNDDESPKSEPNTDYPWGACIGVGLIVFGAKSGWPFGIVATGILLTGTVLLQTSLIRAVHNSVVEPSLKRYCGAFLFGMALAAIAVAGGVALDIYL
jgi:hypothetical protein